MKPLKSPVIFLLTAPVVSLFIIPIPPLFPCLYFQQGFIALGIVSLIIPSFFIYLCYGNTRWLRYKLHLDFLPFYHMVENLGFQAPKWYDFLQNLLSFLPLIFSNLLILYISVIRYQIEFLNIYAAFALLLIFPGFYFCASSPIDPFGNKETPTQDQLEGVNILCCAILFFFYLIDQSLNHPTRNFIRDSLQACPATNSLLIEQLSHLQQSVFAILIFLISLITCYHLNPFHKLLATWYNRHSIRQNLAHKEALGLLEDDPEYGSDDEPNNFHGERPPVYY